MRGKDGLAAIIEPDNRAAQSVQRAPHRFRKVGIERNGFRVRQVEMAMRQKELDFRSRPFSQGKLARFTEPQVPLVSVLNLRNRRSLGALGIIEAIYLVKTSHSLH